MIRNIHMYIYICIYLSLGNGRTDRERYNICSTTAFSTYLYSLHHNQSTIHQIIAWHCTKFLTYLA